MPGVASLVGALYQMFRDEAAYQKQAELQRQQQIYNLSVTSHMANVAFDKHVEFCEKYITKMNEGIRKLLSEGPKKEALAFAKDLTQLRLKYISWLTEDIVKKISKYEDQLSKIGFKCGTLECANFDDKLRAKLYEEIDNIFSEVVSSTNENEESMSEKIVTHLQDLLGIKELTLLRQNAIKEALKSIK